MMSGNADEFMSCNDVEVEKGLKIKTTIIASSTVPGDIFYMKISQNQDRDDVRKEELQVREKMMAFMEAIAWWDKKPIVTKEYKKVNSIWREWMCETEEWAMKFLMRSLVCNILF